MSKRMASLTKEFEEQFARQDLNIRVITIRMVLKCHQLTNFGFLQRCLYKIQRLCRSKQEIRTHRWKTVENLKTIIDLVDRGLGHERKRARRLRELQREHNCYRNGDREKYDG